MNEFTTWTELFLNSLQSLSENCMAAIPGIIGALLIILVGWLFAKLMSSAITRLLGVLKFDALAERFNVKEFLNKANIKIAPSKIIGKFVYWLLLLLVFITVSDTLGWNAVSAEISNLVRFLPKLLVAIIFFIIGTFIASFIRDLISGATASLGISTGKIISNFVFYLLFIIVSLTAMEQAGIDTSIITSNLLLIMGTVLFAAAISYGFASREILSNILAAFFSRRIFKVGQTIEIDGVRGKIVETNNISITLQSGDKEKTVVPSHQLISNRVKIIEA